MNTSTQLPKVEKRKKINVKKLEQLAKKVRKYFDEEARYMQERNLRYGDNKTTKFIFPS